MKSAKQRAKKVKMLPVRLYALGHVVWHAQTPKARDVERTHGLEFQQVRSNTLYIMLLTAHQIPPTSSKKAVTILWCLDTRASSPKGTRRRSDFWDKNRRESDMGSWRGCKWPGRQLHHVVKGALTWGSMWRRWKEVNSETFKKLGSLSDLYLVRSVGCIQRDRGKRAKFYFLRKLRPPTNFSTVWLTCYDMKPICYSKLYYDHYERAFVFVWHKKNISKFFNDSFFFFTWPTPGMMQFLSGTNKIQQSLNFQPLQNTFGKKDAIML